MVDDCVLPQAEERVHDAPDGPEQADEWRRARGRGQKRQRTLELRELLCCRPPHGALDIGDTTELSAELRVFCLALGAGQSHELLIAGAKDLGDWTLLHLWLAAWIVVRFLVSQNASMKRFEVRRAARIWRAL